MKLRPRGTRGVDTVTHQAAGAFLAPGRGYMINIFLIKLSLLSD